MEKKYRIVGMACPHCQATVTKAISAVEGVESVNVDLSSGVATVNGDAAPEAVSAAVYAAGFTVAE